MWPCLNLQLTTFRNWILLENEILGSVCKMKKIVLTFVVLGILSFSKAYSAGFYDKSCKHNGYTYAVITIRGSVYSSSIKDGGVYKTMFDINQERKIANFVLPEEEKLEMLVETASCQNLHDQLYPPTIVSVPNHHGSGSPTDCIITSLNIDEPNH